MTNKKRGANLGDFLTKKTVEDHKTEDYTDWADNEKPSGDLKESFDMACEGLVPNKLDSEAVRLLKERLVWAKNGVACYTNTTLEQEYRIRVEEIQNCINIISK